MKQKGLSQEGLKLIACLTMLIDHVAATLVVRQLIATPVMSPEYAGMYWLYQGMRIIGRIAFPIYCFLLVEGSQHTRNPEKYALRLAIGMVLSEIPFDMAFSPYGTVPDWTSNSVMVTLLLGFVMLRVLPYMKGIWKLAVVGNFYLMAELLRTDYGGLGILVIAAFCLTRGLKHEKLILFLSLLLILTSGGKDLEIFGIWVSMEGFAIFSLIPIFCYSRRKLTHNKAAQWAFYLFYPVHILILALLEVWIFG